MTRAEKKENARIVALGCIICGGPAEIHHVRRLATSKKRERAPKIPLCWLHHRDGGWGVAVHAGRATFEAQFGTELELLQLVNALLTTGR